VADPPSASKSQKSDHRLLLEIPTNPRKMIELLFEIAANRCLATETIADDENSLQPKQQELHHKDASQEKQQQSRDENSIIDEGNNQCWDSTSPSKLRSNTDSTSIISYNLSEDGGESVTHCQEEEEEDAEEEEDVELEEYNNNRLGPTLKIDGMEVDPSILSSHVNHPSQNLQHSVTYDINIGFQRLRKAMLSTKSTFWIKRILNDELKYTEISRTEWDHHDTQIGLPSSSTKLVEKQEQKELIGAKRNTTFRLPKTLLIPSTMGYDTTTVTDYTNHNFTILTSTRTPNIPFGNRIVTHAQIIVFNKGRNNTQMVCSMEVEFPLGPPIGFASKIKKEAKASTMSYFDSVQRTIRRFVEEEQYEEDDNDGIDDNDSDISYHDNVDNDGDSDISYVYDLNLEEDEAQRFPREDVLLLPPTETLQHDYDMKPKDRSRNCVELPLPPPPPQTQTPEIEPTEFVYDLSQFTDEPRIYRRDRIQTEEIVPSYVFTTSTTGIMRGIGSGSCIDMTQVSNTANTDNGCIVSPVTSPSSSNSSISSKSNKNKNNIDTTIADDEKQKLRKQEKRWKWSKLWKGSKRIRSGRGCICGGVDLKMIQ